MLINLSTLPYKETFSIPPRPRNGSNPRTNECLYLNARSLNNKTSELQTLVIDVYLIAITELGSNLRLETVRSCQEMTLQSIVKTEWIE